MKKRLFIALVTVCSLSTVAQQQKDTTTVTPLETVELTSTKFKLNQSKSGKVVTVISSKDLEHYQGATIASVLDNLAGIEILGNQSVAGQNLTYSFRGGSNRQVLILIDGIAINNPSAIANDYDLRLLPLDQVESIEIIKGATSALYGSGAATAVLNIKLKSAKENFKLSLNTSVATNSNQEDKSLGLNNLKQGISLSKKFDNSSVYFSFDNTSSSGLSAAKGTGFKDDPFKRQNLFLKYRLKATKKVSVSGLVNYNKFNTNFDAAGFVDAENLTKSEEFRLGVQATYVYNKGDFNIKSAFNTITNDNKETSFPSVNKGKIVSFDAYNRYHFNENTQLLLGLNTQLNEMNSLEIPFGETSLTKVIDNANFNSIDPYVNFVFNADSGLNLNIGARLNNHSDYGSHLVYTLNPSYTYKINGADFKLMASYSTAYITPTLFQLFSPNYGYNKLKPEENQTLESGFTLSAKKYNFSMVYFYRQEQNFIDFTLLDPATFKYGYRNIDSNFYVSGLETDFKYTISSKIKLKANYTLTNVADTRIRIPKHKFNASLWFATDAKTNFSLDFNYTDKRTDSFFDMTTFTASKVVLKSFSLVNLYANRALVKNKLYMHANITNIFNVSYQELVGFSTRGRNFLLGFKLDI
ncbi:MAG: TonB-dependent receptor [Flavobacteriaceae bacterium]|nr:TonB-dependent receptor [Flavobacteriaceae bacterium]